LSIIAIYVDDILICSDTKSILKEIVEKEKGLFLIKDLGEIYYILGIECVQNEKRNSVASEDVHCTLG
jgi:Reverse transcriptase (RNA-dependent DNA polymerase)